MDHKDRNFTALALSIFVLGLILWTLFAPKSNALADPLGDFVAYEVTCTDTATSMAPTTLSLSQRSRLRSAFKFKNGATQIFIGGSDVTATTKGYPIAVDGEQPVDGHPGKMHCITAAGSSTVEVIAGVK